MGKTKVTGTKTWNEKPFDSDERVFPGSMVVQRDDVPKSVTDVFAPFERIHRVAADVGVFYACGGGVRQDEGKKEWDGGGRSARGWSGIVFPARTAGEVDRLFPPAGGCCRLLVGTRPPRLPAAACPSNRLTTATTRVVKERTRTRGRAVVVDVLRM